MSADEPFIAEIIFSADPQDPMTVDLDSKALKITLMNRQQIARLDADLGQRPGVYLLLGGTGSEAAVEVYIGKTGGGKQGFRGPCRT